MSDPLASARAALKARQGGGARYDAPAAPHRELAWARFGTAYFARKLNEMDDAALWSPSARAGWSRRRIIASVALQARAMAQAIGAATGGGTEEYADTGAGALDLAETLPARALRNLAAHADIHLNVVWRDLADAGWDQPLEGVNGAATCRQTAMLRARTLWESAVELANGGRLRDAPADFLAAVNTAGQR